jgi:hypothetical protein
MMTVFITIFLMDGLQELYAMDKIGLFDSHYQINGVKVFLTPEASGQIGFWIYRGIKLAAQGTKKTKAPICHSTRYAQRFFDKCLNADFIAQSIKQVGGKAPICHIRIPDQAWASS